MVSVSPRVRSRFWCMVSARFFFSLELGFAVSMVRVQVLNIFLGGVLAFALGLRLGLLLGLGFWLCFGVVTCFRVSIIIRVRNTGRSGVRARSRV